MQAPSPKAQAALRQLDRLLSTKGDIVVGRDAERDQLLQAFRRIREHHRHSSSGHRKNTHAEPQEQEQENRKNELVLISGRTGLGRTTLAHSIEQVVRESKGYFVSGKFDQMQRPDEPTAFGEALTEYVSQVLDRNEVLNVREAIRRQGIDFATDGKELVAVVPALAKILASDEDEQNNSGGAKWQSLNGNDEDYYFSHTNAAVLHFKHVCRMLVRAISDPERPVVFLLEDIHFADEGSIDLLQFILKDGSNSGGVLFIGTYRDNSDSGATRTVQSMLKTMHDSEVTTITHLQLNPLREREVRRLVAHVLPVNENYTSRLATVVHSITDNIFYIFEIIRYFVEREILTFEGDSLECVWDNLEEFQTEIKEMDDLILARIAHLSEQSQEILKVAACLGSKVDAEILQFFVTEPVGLFLQEFTANGLFRYDEARNSWSFAHDSIQETIYQLIPPDDKVGYHYRIGRKFWRVLDEARLSDFVFLVVGQLLLGSNRFQDDRERVAVAKLCLSAGIKGVSLSSFQTSFAYLHRGIALLGPNAWREQYELSLELQSAAAEVATSLGLFETALEHVETILKHARNFSDTLRAQAVKVHTIGSKGMFEDALDAALAVLGKLDIQIAQPNRIHIFLEWTRLRSILRKRTNESLMRLPLMVDRDKIAAIQMLNLVLLYAVMAKGEWLTAIGFKMVRLTLDYGLSAVSCIGFGLYSVIASGVGHDIEEGYRFGKLSFSICNKFNARAFLARLSAIYYEGVHNWKRPVSQMFKPLERAYHIGLDTGDVEFALACASISWFTRVELESLTKLEAEMMGLSERMELHQQKNFLFITRPIHQMMHNMMGLQDGDVTILRGDILDETMEEQIEMNHLTSLWRNAHTVILCCFFGQFRKANEVSLDCRELAKLVFGPMGAGLVYFYFGFADVADARARKKKRASIARRQARQLGKWSLKSPHNFLGKYLFLKAELAAMSRCKSTVSRFVTAIAASREGGFIGQTALANERLALYLFEQGEKESAGPYFVEALSLYQEWGAWAKVRDLQETTTRLRAL